MESQRDIRAPKFKSFGGAVSPINMINFTGGRCYSSMLDPYASDSSDSPSPLTKYLCSADPAATAASSPVFITPVKVEEDVIVMDGIPVPKSNKAGGEVRMRLPLMSSNSVIGSFVGGRSNSTSSSSSGGGGRGSGTENCKFYKNRLCRFWENCGLCQFGSECQFAHGKEELRHHRSSGKIKPEISKLNNSLEGSSSSSYGSKFPPISQVKEAAAAAEAFSLPSVPTEMAFPASPVRVKQLSGTGSTISSGTIPNTTLPRSDWTPQNDGIEVSLPSGSTEEKNPSKEDVDACIEKVLYGTNTRKRLPVFLEICPDC